MFLLLRIFVFIAVTISAPSLILAEQDLRQVILDAQRASLKNIKSGAVSGKIKTLTRNADDKEWELHTSADLEGKFLDRKYYLKLQYAATGKNDYEKSITICDQVKITTSRFSHKIHPAAAEEYIFALQEKSMVGNYSPFAGFPWDLSKLMLVDLEQLLKKYDESQLKLKLTADGDIAGEITSESNARTYLFSKNAGFNFTEFKTVNLKTGNITSEWQAKWKQIDKVWVTTSFSRTRDAPENGERVEVEFSKYDLNCAVDPKTFAFSSLELPITARMIDYRPDALVRTYLQYPSAKKLSTKGDNTKIITESKETP